MKKHCLIAAAVSLTILVTPRFVLAAGGHHHHGGHHGGGHHHVSHGHHYSHHGHHYAHHGLHISLGHQFHSYRTHHYGHYSDPTYYTTSYPSYSSYRYSSCYRPTVVYSQPARRVVIPQQPPAEPSEKPKVDPPPQPVPGSPDPPPNPGSTRRWQDSVLFTSIPSPQRVNTSQDTNSSRPVTLDLGLSTLSTLANRPIVSDEATPWVVGKTSLSEDAAGLVDHNQSHEPTQASKREAQPKPTQQIPATMRGIARLSPEDQQAALAQRICPVSGDLLGSQGRPIKAQIGGRAVFVCCDGCVKDLRTAASKHLASDR